MNSTQFRNWSVLCWNIRGINASKKWDALKDKVLEVGCHIVCLQETKREAFDSLFVRNFLPPNFDGLVFVPSVGASGGILTAWKTSFLQGTLIFSNDMAQIIKFTSKLDNSSWNLVNIYAPCTPGGKRDFINWFKDINIQDGEDWILLGDFNLIRKPEDRNKPGGDIQEMFLFNSVISSLDLTEIPLHGRKFTWSNKQTSPLLEKLDWVFTSNSWVSPFLTLLSSH